MTKPIALLIDNGHDCMTKGKGSIMPNGTLFEEWEFNRIIKLRWISELLREGVQLYREYAGLHSHCFVDLVPESVGVSLTERVDRANLYYEQLRETHHVLFVSIHADAFTDSRAKGMTVFTSEGHTISDHWALKIVKQLNKDIPELKSRGQKEANFYVLRKTNCPAVLLELGFMTNPHDVEFIFKSLNQERIVKSLTKSIQKDV